MHVSFSASHTLLVYKNLEKGETRPDMAQQLALLRNSLPGTSFSLCNLVIAMTLIYLLFLTAIYFIHHKYLLSNY